MKPYEHLTYAILEGACKDYLWLAKTIKNNEGKEKVRKYWREHALGVSGMESAKKKKKETIEFFYSDFYKLLSDIDPDWLIENLEEKAQKMYEKGARR